MTESNSRTSDRPRILVLGAGFAGVAFCKRFKGDADVILVDQHNHHLFQPLLYQVAMAGLAAPDIAAPVRSIFRRQRNVASHMARVTGIDLEARHVFFGDYALGYDYLVIACGGVTTFFGNDGWAEHALGLKTLDDAMAIRRRILTSFELAENINDADERRRLMTIVVVGGGPTGVELAGSMAELARQVFKKDFRQIDTESTRIILVEGGDRLLDAYPEELTLSAKKQLEGLGVEVRLNTLVAEITDDRVILNDGVTIETRNVLWGAGVVANPLTREMGVELDRVGRIVVDRDLALPGRPNVFAVGDVALVKRDDGTPVPGVAPAAMQMGRHVAKRIMADLKSRPGSARHRKAFEYFDKGSMATIGRSRAVAWMGRLRFTGYPAWMAWLVIHLIFLVSFRNKVGVLLSWMYSYFTFRRGARIIFGGDGHEGDDRSGSPDLARPRPNATMSRK